MVLRKTTILPTDEKRLACEMFRELVYEEPVVLMVVLGRGADAERFVERADRFAGHSGDPRLVVWARKPEQIAAVLEELDGEPALLDGLADSRGFALSLSNTVRDVLSSDEPVPDQFRIFRAFVRAEADQ